ncbi:MAG: CheW protein [Polyangiaceae bacterium]|jgi:chemotaxis-related protein WspB|nr:CheW protein [Polyangiaceae bacterium]
MLVVTFRIAGSAYALRCDDVVAVIPEVELRPLAQGAACLRGVFAYRGELTPVVDLCQLVGGYRCPARLSSRIALVRSALSDGTQRTIGLLAEHMTEARHLAETLPACAKVASLPYFGEVRIEAGEPLQFLEPGAILHASGLALPSPSTVMRITAGEKDREPPQP